MVKSCCAVGCHNTYKKGDTIKFYRFPADPDKRARWVAAVNRKDWIPNEYTWICSEHFLNGQRSDNPLAPNYVPSVFKHVDSPRKRKLVKDMDNFVRRQDMKRRRQESVGSESEDEIDKQATVEPTTEAQQAAKDQLMYQKSIKKLDVQREKSLNDELQSQVDQLKEENTVIRKSFDDLKGRVCMKQEELRGDDKKVKYYTGLPTFGLLKTLYDFVATDLPSDITGSKLDSFEQFIMTLMKLRLNLGDQDLAYRFNISQPTVSRYFARWLDLLYTKLSCLIFWPDRDTLLKTMPIEFRKHFKKCAIIIDCFELFIQRPTSLPARAQTWSNYKHHNTVKYLIGITPQGTIAFISKGWGGRASDVYITEHCDLLKNLLPGDVVLADRGFTIQDSVRLYCAEVRLPPFTKGKKQLSAIEVDGGRRLSRVRIHVERIIGMVKQKFTILQSTVPTCLVSSDEHSVPAIDKIVLVCSALCNCCDPIVPSD